jgi:hypothetical protein
MHASYQHKQSAHRVFLGTDFLCKEFLNASRWYFVGPPPAEGGRRPHAEAAASPTGWPPLNQYIEEIQSRVEIGARLSFPHSMHAGEGGCLGSFRSFAQKYGQSDRHSQPEGRGR